MPGLGMAGRGGHWLLLALVLLFGIWGRPDQGFAQESPGGWVFSAIPQTDLWFHGMAVVDPVGPGPSPLYDPAYPAEVRRAKDDAGQKPTALDARAGYFREAFRRDPAFEVLHFIPLYFPRAGRAEFFSAMKLLVGTREGIPRAQSANTAFGLAAVGSVLTTQGQRMVLGEFVSALEAEWDQFFGEWWQEGSAPRERIQDSLQKLWGEEFGPALGPALQKLGMSGGIVAFVPAIGKEGRVFSGSSQNPMDNVLVVAAPASPDRSMEAVYSMLREVSFPLVRRVIEQEGRTVGNQSEEEKLASTAAVRSGALILEKYRPDDLMDYQRFFLTQAGRPTPPGEATEGPFRETFPLDRGVEQALGEEIFTMVTNGGAG